MGNGRRLIANLIYSGTKCLDVFVNGEVLRRDGITQSLDEQKVALQLEHTITDYYSEI